MVWCADCLMRRRIELEYRNSLWLKLLDQLMHCSLHVLIAEDEFYPYSRRQHITYESTISVEPRGFVDHFGPSAKDFP
jgi:hypothetical protein